MTTTTTTTTETRQPDPDLLNGFVGQMIGDLGATISAGLVLIGDQLGIYRAMADGTPVTAEALAERTGLSATYLRPWLANQAAAGYVTHHPDSAGIDWYALSPEQAAALANPDSPAYFAPSMQVAVGALRDVDAIADRFRTGAGFGWHEHDPNLFVGTERFFKPGYVTNLVDGWLPALDGVVAKLQAGARVADVGCGHAASTVLMAAAYPRSTFIGADYHQASIVVARRRAEEAGVTANTSFVTVDALDLTPDTDTGYDLVTMFDCLHDMGDPVAAAHRIRAALAPDGVFMLVEPRAGDHTADNLNPLGRVFYGASTLICTPSSLAQPGQAAIGTQAGPARITTILHQAGFHTIRIAAETPVNHVYEARE
jgi:2-polyprenyl-3-methyl-5-hydroxy-6-metoxy-1,4-benzoquinol methylase